MLFGFFRKTAFTPFEEAILKELEAQFEPKYAEILKHQLSDINVVQRGIDDNEIALYKFNLFGQVDNTRSAYFPRAPESVRLKAILTVGDQQHGMKFSFLDGSLFLLQFGQDANMKKYRKKTDVSVKLLTSFQYNDWD